MRRKCSKRGKGSVTIRAPAISIKLQSSSRKGASPKSSRGVRALPGVGDYTAGAVLLHRAAGCPAPAVDGNVLRVLTRLLADETNIDSAGAKDKFSALLKEVYPQEAGEFCQALMELGALVCLPNGEPQCLLCPWRELCLARLHGEWERYPVRAPKRCAQKGGAHRAHIAL